MATRLVLPFAIGGPHESAQYDGTFSFVAARANFHSHFELRVVKAAGAVTGYNRARGWEANGAIVNSLGTPTIYAVFPFVAEVLPAVAGEEICAVHASAAYKAHVRINSSGTLSIFDAADTLLGTTTFALTPGTTYYIGVQCSTGTTASWALRIYNANFVQQEEISGTGNLHTSNVASFSLGLVTSRSNEAIDFRYGPLIGDDATWPERIGAKRVLLTANGTPHQWTSGTGASDYQEVNEAPANDATYIMSPASGAPNFSFFDDAGFADSVAALRGILAMARFAENTTSIGGCGIVLRQGATDVGSSGFDVGSVRTLVYLREAQPVGGAWDATAINNTRIGVFEAQDVSTRCTAVWKIVIYTPSSGAPPENTPPSKPTCSVLTKTHNSVTLNSSAFSDADGGDTHAASQWQVDVAAGDFSSPVADSGQTAVNLTSCVLNGLPDATNLKGRVRHKDDSGDGATEWSAWSDAVAFTTDAAPPSGNLLRLHAIGES